MRDLLNLIRWMLLGLVRSRRSLEAENLALRHQLNVLHRRAPKRPALRDFDRLLFVCLYRIAPRILDTFTIVKPEPLSRLKAPGPCSAASASVRTNLISGTHNMTQMTLAEHDHMIEALVSDRADQTFDIAVLPRRSRRCRSVANAHRSNAARKCLAVDAVPVADEILWRALPTTCLADLPGDPFGSRVRSDAEPQDAPSIMSENQQPVEQPE